MFKASVDMQIRDRIVYYSRLTKDNHLNLTTRARNAGQQYDSAQYNRYTAYKNKIVVMRVMIDAGEKRLQCMMSRMTDA